MSLLSVSIAGQVVAPQSVIYATIH